jgi:hypothetical protein
MDDHKPGLRELSQTGVGMIERIDDLERRRRRRSSLTLNGSAHIVLK